MTINLCVVSICTASLTLIGVIRVLFDELVVLYNLGEGGYGEVSLAEWRGIKVALKKLKSSVPVDDESHEARTLMYVARLSAVSNILF